MAKIVLIRGVPGSGKSTIAKQMLGFKHIENDMFMYENGEYVYSSERIQIARALCLLETKRAMEARINVVVSNTFTRFEEMMPYIELARANGYQVETIIAKGRYDNIHNVPEDVVAKMTNRFEFEV